ncbi:ATP-binding protein [Haliangium sp.]|uniref:ATP-binding protein n=1 Tax=Haliangium sp. TaxID=2663208 RepID=UPI003D0DF7DA
MLTSNRSTDEPPATFCDLLLASAAIDRLLHDAHVLVIEGDSRHNPPQQNAVPGARPPPWRSKPRDRLSRQGGPIAAACAPSDDDTPATSIRSSEDDRTQTQTEPADDRQPTQKPQHQTRPAHHHHGSLPGR